MCRRRGHGGDDKRDIRRRKVSTIAGNGNTTGYSGDNGPATSAQLNDPVALTVDAAGRVYIADAGNHVIRILVPDSPDQHPSPKTIK